MDTLLFALQFASSWAMVAIIWFVQINQYPLMGLIANLKEYQAMSIKRTEKVVIPFMLVELITGILLLFKLSYLFYLAFALLIFIWIQTFISIVPIHMKLKEEPNAELVASLVQKNWTRTVLWSLKGLIVLFLYLN